MDSSSVLAATDARGIATITFNRPDKANSYDYPMIAAVAQHAERFSAEDAFRIGFVHELCDDAQALEGVLAAQLEEVLLAGPRAAASAKRVARRLMGGLPGEAESAELQEEFNRAQASAEAKEG